MQASKGREASTKPGGGLFGQQSTSSTTDGAGNDLLDIIGGITGQVIGGQAKGERKTPPFTPPTPPSTAPAVPTKPGLFGQQAATGAGARSTGFDARGFAAAMKRGDVATAEQGLFGKPYKLSLERTLEQMKQRQRSKTGQRLFEARPVRRTLFR